MIHTSSAVYNTSLRYTNHTLDFQTASQPRRKGMSVFILPWRINSLGGIATSGMSLFNTFKQTYLLESRGSGLKGFFRYDIAPVVLHSKIFKHYNTNQAKLV